MSKELQILQLTADGKSQWMIAEEELKRMEDFRKAQTEIEKKNEKPMSQKMFKVV